MFYLFVRQWDECGEGIRAELYEFSDKANADAASDNWRKQEDVVEIRMITGDTIYTYQPDSGPPLEDPKLPSSDEILKISKLTSIDDLENKENV